MKLSLNVGGLDRIIRLVLGVVLIAVAIVADLSGTTAVVVYVIAAIALLTGVVQFCPLNALFGFNSCKVKVDKPAE